MQGLSGGDRLADREILGNIGKGKHMHVGVMRLRAFFLNKSGRALANRIVVNKLGTRKNVVGCLEV